MRVIRLILTTFVLLAVLPWGAYAARFAVTPPTAEAQSTLYGGACGAAVAAECLTAARDATVMPPPRRCHGPALPGAPCGPDAVLGQAVVTPQAHHTTVPAPRDTTVALSGRALRPNLGPPRIS
jgi:hypothetical protein